MMTIIIMTMMTMMTMMIMLSTFCTENEWQCPAGYHRCMESSQCVRDYLCCNGVENCLIGTDEHLEFCSK